LVLPIKKIGKDYNMLYSISLFLHITGALALFAALGIEWLCFVNLRRSETKDSICEWINQASILKRLFPIASILLLITGIYMSIAVWKDAGWVIIGFIGLVALAIAGGVVTGKKFDAIKNAAEKGNEPPLPEVLKMINDKSMWTSLHVRTAIVLGIVYIMTLKTDLLDSMIVLVIAAILGFIFAKITESSKEIQKAEA
jgi:hypothetical protein